MMDVKIQIDRATRRKMEETLRKFAEATGKAVEDGIDQIARGGAKQLAIKVQPFGIAAKAQGILEGTVAKQAHRAISNANVTGKVGTAAIVHRQIRDNRGRVPKGIADEGRNKREPIGTGERNSHVDKQVKKAGRAKAAWIEAGEKVNGKKINVKQWISRHVGAGFGDAKKKGKGLKYSVEISNSTPYIGKIQSPGNVASAVGIALKNGFTRLQKIIDKEIEKANRTT